METREKIRTRITSRYVLDEGKTEAIRASLEDSRITAASESYLWARKLAKEIPTELPTSYRTIVARETRIIANDIAERHNALLSAESLEVSKAYVHMSAADYEKHLDKSLGQFSKALQNLLVNSSRGHQTQLGWADGVDQVQLDNLSGKIDFAPTTADLIKSLVTRTKSGARMPTPIGKVPIGKIPKVGPRELKAREDLHKRARAIFERKWNHGDSRRSDSR